MSGPVQVTEDKDEQLSPFVKEHRSSRQEYSRWSDNMRHALWDYGSMKGGGKKRVTGGSVRSGTRPKSSGKKRGHGEQNVGRKAGGRSSPSRE